MTALDRPLPDRLRRRVVGRRRLGVVAGAPGRPRRPVTDAVPTVEAAPLPAGTRLVLDPATRRVDGGTVLVGGSPRRLLRLTAAGARLVDRLAADEPLPPAAGAHRLARRLLDAGMAHPRPGPGPFTAGDVTVVVPVRDRPDGLAGTLAALGAVAAVVVVDDGSTDATATAAVAAAAGAALHRHDRTRGPAASRNTGWRVARTEVVAFLDADCEPAPGWLTPLLAHLADPAVAAVAPRVVAGGGAGRGAAGGALARYEARRSPLDLGAREATVRRGTRVAYVPTAALVARRAALAAAGGFDEGLRVGEDVDLVWRLDAAGGRVRYEPAAVVTHPPRRGVASWLAQRWRYGTSAAPLSRRHPGAVAPLAVSPWSLALWALVALRRPVAALALAGATTAALARRLPALDHRWREAARLAAAGHLAGGAQVAGAVLRPWWPVTAVAAAAWPRLRPALAAAALVPAAWQWARARPALDPLRWMALRLADDAAYAAGVWTGALRHRAPAPLLPRLPVRFDREHTFPLARVERS